MNLLKEVIRGRECSQHTCKLEYDEYSLSRTITLSLVLIFVVDGNKQREFCLNSGVILIC